MKMCATEEVWLYSFSVFPLDNGERSGSRPDRFPHGKESPVGTGWVAEWVSHSLGIHPVVVATILSELEQVGQENIEIESRTSSPRSFALTIQVYSLKVSLSVLVPLLHIWETMVHNLADNSRVLSQPVSYIAIVTENNQRPILATFFCCHHS
jgi:hypothetical protein